MRVGIAGYGNLARGVEAAVTNAPDMELVAIFTRRDPASVTGATDTPIYAWDAMADMTDQIDVMVLCGGSATDLPTQTPQIARLFTVVDSFDTHANIPSHFAHVDEAAREAGTLGVISCGWDPGLFSLARLYANAALPDGVDYTFWGRGVSQGHSDAIRRIPGVADARQYTVPVPEAVEAARSGSNPTLTTRQKHTRECYVVAEEGADHAAIEQAIVTMPRLGHSQRQDRSCRRVWRHHRVLPAARLQPPLHGQRPGERGTCRISHEAERPGGCLHHV